MGRAVPAAVPRRSGIAGRGNVARPGGDADTEAKGCRREPPTIVAAVTLAVFPIPSVTVVIMAAVLIVVAAMRIVSTPVVDRENVGRHLRICLSAHWCELRKRKGGGECGQSQPHREAAYGDVT
jgi:hypothetical protein